MSQRLTTDIRKNILRSVLTATFKDKKEALKEQENALAEKVFRFELGDDLVTLIDSLPEGIFREHCRIMCHIAGSYTDLYFLKQRRIPYKLEHSRIIISGGTALADEYQGLSENQKQLRENEASLEAKLRALLDSVTTDKTLIATWPECEKYLPPMPVKSTLPAVTISEINAAIAASKG